MNTLTELRPEFPQWMVGRFLQGIPLVLKAIRAWVQWGVEDQPSHTLKRKVLHTNLIALAGLLTLLMLDTVFLLIDNPALSKAALWHLPFYGLFPVVPWLNRRGRIDAARWMLVLLAFGCTLSPIAIAFGAYLGTQYYFLLFAISPLAIFTSRQWLPSLTIFAFSMLIFALVEIGMFKIHPLLLDLQYPYVQFLRNLNFFSAYCTMLVFILSARV